MAAAYNISVKQGETKILLFQYRDSSNFPIDLSRFLGRGWIVSKVVDQAPLGEITVNIIDGFNGEVQVIIPASVSSAIPCKGRKYTDINEFQYDVELYNPLPGFEEDVIRFLNGAIMMSPESTKTVTP